ncbi:UNVERIFIED_CONTAM: hypothetical protein GTU68_052345 [Idotea baltica]|nr:hypothetical protein [Idotea baltica]
MLVVLAIMFFALHER